MPFWTAGEPEHEPVIREIFLAKMSCEKEGWERRVELVREERITERLTIDEMGPERDELVKYGGEGTEREIPSRARNSSSSLYCTA